jgi:plastocyanin
MKRLVSALALVVLAAFLAACSGTSAAPGTPAPSADPDALTISSKDLTFSTDKLAAPAGEAFQIVYDNQESAPHNVAIYADQGYSQKVLVEEPFSGPKVVTYSVPALDAGTYYFRCDLHTNMTGTIEVE